MNLAEAIDESVLADARTVDEYAREKDPSLPSVENTLRIVRDVHPDTLREIAHNVWGTGGTVGKDLVGTSFDECITELDIASNKASGWTGEGKNAYSQRMQQTKLAINEMREPSEDVGRALEGIADAWDEAWGSTIAQIITILGIVVTIIGLIAAIPTGGLGLVLSVIGLIVTAAGLIWSEQQKEHTRTTALEGAVANAKDTIKSANKAEP